MGGSKISATIKFIIEPGQQAVALLSLPAAALRLDDDTVDRLNKLGLRQVKDFIGMPKTALRRRFGGKSKSESLGRSGSSNHGRHEDTKRHGVEDHRTVGLSVFRGHILTRINQALGLEEEIIQPVHPIEPYQERLPCLEPIVTATGIEIALQRLLENLCKRLKQEGKGIRTAILKCYRIDGKIEEITSALSVQVIMRIICSGCLN